MRILHVPMVMLLCCLSAFITRSQSLPSFVYDHPGRDCFGDALWTSDGNVLLTGYTCSDSNSFFIAKFDLTGNMIWSHRYKRVGTAINNGWTYITKALLEVESGYYVAGYKNKKGRLMKFSKEGNFLWDKNYGLDYSHIPKIEFSLMALSADNRILMSGHSGYGHSDNQSLVYFSVDTNGNNEKFHWIGQLKDLRAAGILPMPDGGSLLVTTSGENFGSSGDQYPQVYRFNDQDSAIWMKKIVLPFPARVSDCIITADHHIVITGGGTDSIFILKTDTLCNLLWLKTAALKQDIQDDGRGIATIAEAASGNLVLSGREIHDPNFEYYYNSLLLETDAMGNLLWMKKMATAPQVTVSLEKILFPGNGNRLWCGFGKDVDADEVQNIYFVGTDSLGNNSSCSLLDTTLYFNNSAILYLLDDEPGISDMIYFYLQDTSTEISSTTHAFSCPAELDIPLAAEVAEGISSLMVYPNPASEVVYFNTLFSTASKFHIYDLYGHIVATAETAGHTLMVEVSTLPSGIYFYMVENGANIYKGTFEVQHAGY